jgi:hypothetical protein
MLGIYVKKYIENNISYLEVSTSWNFEVKMHFGWELI